MIYYFGMFAVAGCTFTTCNRLCNRITLESNTSRQTHFTKIVLSYLKTFAFPAVFKFQLKSEIKDIQHRLLILLLLSNLQKLVGVPVQQTFKFSC